MTKSEVKELERRTAAIVERNKTFSSYLAGVPDRVDTAMHTALSSIDTLIDKNAWDELNRLRREIDKHLGRF